ncbi:ABC-type multidrug transport system, ATPase and permease component [Paraoerskovia marina]|uniref:ABC-type multidrug transport system, ATPase and permease component n=1 Tax=Paraoerskovia marina TaxID=545619 RepID=A0A1H1V4F5_9CELL|nr:ABC transporter ATP-binding protein [Paraoerskovia marina]SDS79602.1 ABC-type multidrug transport system, ATPase and permease component [Paraoerskovia marina]
MLVAVRALPLPDPGTPPLTGPIRLLWWQALRQKWILLTAIALGIVVFVCQAVQPYLLGRAIDEGLADGFGSALWGWAALLLAVGALLITASAIGHRFDVQCWMRGAFGMSQLVGRTVSESGDAITEELPTGEVVSAVANDSLRLAEIYAIAAQFIGSLSAYLVVAAIMLNQSVELGLIVVLGLPAVALVLSFLIKPLQQRQSAQREAAGRLTTLGADTVSGLRILRGIGGEQVFTDRYRVKSQEVRQAGVRVAGVQSLLDSLQVLLPGIFVAFVVYIGAMKAIAGEITPGELVAFYGYSAFLGWPLQIATQTLQVATRAHVAAKKLITVLRVEPAAGATPGTAPLPPAGSPLVDETSGLRLEPGRVVALVCEDPDASAAVATRLGRFDDAAELATPVRLGGTLLADLDHAELRGRVVVAEATPQLFSGTLSDELDVHGTATREALLAAITVADAHDVLSSVPDGLDGVLPEKGRSLSGGQRQRVALARAILTSPEILVLVEPTSAVDAHTEARIAVRLAEARAGRTTLIVTASPLVLGEVDEVAFLDGGVVATRGTHRELLDRPLDAPGGESAARYRAVVGRNLDADAAPETSDTHPGVTEGAR